MLTECTGDQMVSRLVYLFTQGLEDFAAGIRKLAEKIIMLGRHFSYKAHVPISQVGIKCGYRQPLYDEFLTSLAVLTAPLRPSCRADSPNLKSDTENYGNMNATGDGFTCFCAI
jgi:hypothetical protein